jgi:predicted transcriptional regulator
MQARLDRSFHTHRLQANRNTRVQITLAESQIMEALWRQGALSFEQVMEAVAPQGWSKSTVKTLVNRLLHKQAIASERGGGRHAYRALLARDDYVHAESQGLLDRLFGGQLEPMISHFAHYRVFSDSELERLKRLVADSESGAVKRISVVDQRRPPG